MNAVYGRYLCQPAGDFGFNHAFTRILNTKEGHTDRVKELNAQDRGKYLWKWQTINKDDFDYPERAIP